MKYYVIRNHVASLVLKLLDQPSKYLQLTALRFLRRCVGVKDQVYNRYIIKNSLLAPIFAILNNKNSLRDNLFTSAVAELVEFVKSENVKSLIEYIVENFASTFSGIKWVPAFQGIITKYEQNRDYIENVQREMQQQSSGGGGGGGGGGGVVGGERGDGSITGSSLSWSGTSYTKRFTEEDQDEAYFNESDDDGEAVDGEYQDEKGDNTHESNEGNNQPGEPLTMSTYDSNEPSPPLLPLRRSVSYDSCGDEEEEPFKLRALNSGIAVPTAATKPCPPSRIRVKMTSSLHTLVGDNLATGGGEGGSGEKDGHVKQSGLSTCDTAEEKDMKYNKGSPLLPLRLDGGSYNIDCNEESTRTPPELTTKDEDCEETASD